MQRLKSTSLGQALYKIDQVLKKLEALNPRLRSVVELRAWCKTGDYHALSSDLLAALPKALGEAGIAGPDKTVYYVERK